MDDVKIALLEKEVENLNTQLNRFVSHLESEQRVSVNQGKLIDQINNSLLYSQKMLDKHEAILLNSGKGLSYRLDRLENNSAVSKDVFRFNTQTILSIAAIIISILTLFFK